MRYETCGGGGYGNPLERDPALVRADIGEGKISVARAASEYGVAVQKGSLDIDPAGTERLRCHRNA